MTAILAVGFIGFYQFESTEAQVTNTSSVSELTDKGNSLSNLDPLALDLENVDIMNEKGIALGKLGRYEEAITWFDKALSIDPRNFYSLSYKGAALGLLGRYGESITWIDKSLEVNPNALESLNGKVAALFALGRKQDAMEWIDRALSLDPTNQNALDWKSKLQMLGVNQGISQSNDSQLTKYQNEELGISFQYPSYWTEFDESQRKQTAESGVQLMSGQNLTTNEKAYIETVSVASIYNLDPSYLIGLTFFRYEFPNFISVEEFNQMGLKLVNLAGAKATLVENANITISNQEANRAAIRVDEGPAKGEIISIAFFEGNTVTNIQLGSINTEDQASIIEKIINSIKINN
jgi:tetratricopeptide (TPR) repeat protein